MSLSTNLISYWKLDEASGTRVDSVGGNDLTDNNTVTQAAGKVSNAGQFTTANTEYLSRASNASLQTGDIDYTVAAWIYLDSLGANRWFVTKDAGGAREYGLGYVTGFLRLHFYINDGGFAGVSANTLGLPSAGAWYFVVAWHDSVANTVNIQIDNGTVDSAATAGPQAAATAGEFRIGGRSIGQGAMDGRIDEVGFWKRVLTSDERTELWNSGNGRTYPFSQSASITGSGGVALTGAAITTRGRSLTATGGLRASGAAEILRGRRLIGSGGLSIGGYGFLSIPLKYQLRPRAESRRRVPRAESRTATPRFENRRTMAKESST